MKSAKRVDMNRKFVIFPWLQNGYKIPKDSLESLKYVDYVDKNRINSTVYHEKLRSEARVGITQKSRKRLILEDINMGIFGVIGKMADSKVVERVEDELTKKQNREQASKYCNYIKANLTRIRKTISDLKSETRTLIDH